jgi:sugar phosphate isomerase/epimerase
MVAARSAERLRDKRMMNSKTLNRRSWFQTASSVAAVGCISNILYREMSALAQQPAATFRLKYLAASCMYGYMDLASILPEVEKQGATAIDIWPKVHGNQREQITALGEEAFASLLKKHDVSLGCITQYKLGPFGLQEEMRLAKRFECKTIVTGAEGPTNLNGPELKKAVSAFIEQMKPHLAVAEEAGVTIAIENHGNNLINTPDSLRYLLELRPSKHLGIALAPYHLPQDVKLLASLIEELAPALAVFYAWQHGDGCMTQMPKEKELLQMPGRGTLDFGPLLSALKAIRFNGWTSIFMHPFPRGIPILEKVDEVTAEINRSRNYLEELLQKV